MITLGILCLAHWTLLYRTMFIVIAEWNEEQRACVVVATNPSLLITTFFFSKFILQYKPLSSTRLWAPFRRHAHEPTIYIAMGFDLIILGFTAVALLAKHSARTDLWKLLFQDGLVYFFVSFSCNCIPAVRITFQVTYRIILI